ncbi:SLC37A3 (predicted) [Pycnogonum litorale]
MSQLKRDSEIIEEHIDDDETVHRCRTNKWKQHKAGYTHHHVVVFLLTFFSYALYHATRKTFSNVKFTMGQEWSPTNTSDELKSVYNYQQWNSMHLFPSHKSSMVFMGSLDLIFLLSYSAGLFISGILGDRFNLRYVLSTGMILSSITVFAFGCLSKWISVYSEAYYCVIWGMNGLLQATGWPCVVAIASNWFGKSNRGLILGLWCANASFGNIIGSYAVGGILKYGYEFAYLVTSTMLFAGGIIIFFGMLTSPKEIGLPIPDEGHNEDDNNHRALIDGSDDQNCDTDEENVELKPSDSVPLSFHKAVLLPGVIPYALSYACLKPVNYAFFFWLPYYLSSAYHWEQAESDKLSTWYDVGGIVGGFIFGYISDKFKFRSPILCIMLIISPFTIFFYMQSPNNKIINSVLMSLIGIFLNGAASLLSSAVTADLGRQKAIKDNHEALATVTGIIDGTASFSAAIWQILVPLINTRFGWKDVFILFIVLNVCSLLCLIPPMKEDWKNWKMKRRQRNSETQSIIN